MGNHKKTKSSKKSILRALSLLHALNSPYRYYHQTLTFKRDHSEEEAKQKLDSFLKKLLKRFPKVGVIWFREFQRNETPHFHLMLLFFKNEGQGEEVLPFPENQMLEKFKREVFRIWNHLNGCEVRWEANEMTRHELNEETSGYFLKHVKVAKDENKLIFDRWWGTANRRVLKENSHEVPRAVILEDFRRRFTRKKRPAKTSAERSRLCRKKKQAKHREANEAHKTSSLISSRHAPHLRQNSPLGDLEAFGGREVPIPPHLPMTHGLSSAEPRKQIPFR